MKCLSVKQPFAEFIVSGKKTIELRSWNTEFRGTFLVHAGSNPNLEACELYKISSESLPKGAIVGKATLYGVRRYADGEECLKDKDKHLATGEYIRPGYGFLLKDPVRFAKPVPMPGKLGFFEATVDVPQA